jgi:CRP-like cAMP-binding protein
MKTPNRILSALLNDDRELLRPHLDQVDLPVRTRLAEPARKIPFVYFIEAGLASIVVKGPADSLAEVAVVGYEGVASCAVLLGAERSPEEIFMQISGRALRIPARRLLDAMDESPPLRWALLRYVHTLVMQRNETALSAMRGSLPQRLARWLLMVQDRSSGTTVPLTHEFMSFMLGTRRPGVTQALQVLRDLGLIRQSRGVIEIQNRGGLETLTKGLYGVAESEFERLFSKPRMDGEKADKPTPKNGPSL